MQHSPDNPAIARFCLFIEQNDVESRQWVNEVKKMVDEEREEEEYTTDEDEEEGEDGEDAE